MEIMKNLSNLKSFLLILLITLAWSCGEDEEPKEIWEEEVEQIKDATSQYLNFENAMNDGLFDASGYVPNMGFHYLNPALADGTFDLLKPEVILYVPDDNGDLQMVAVEFSIAPEDPNNHGNPPEGLTGNIDEWHFNEEIGHWQLHVWTIMENPDGIFASFNPAIGD